MRILSKLARKQLVIMPTLLGWLLILVSSTAILYYIFTNSHQYLSKNKPFNGGVLVIDGSLPDYVIESSITAFDQLNCDKIITTGGPVPIGSYHQRFNYYSEVGKEKLIRFGFDSLSLIAVNSPAVLRDRTYTNARSVKKWLDSSHFEVEVINIVALGPHARRSYLLYNSVLGDDFKIGVVSLEDLTYDRHQWWKSSIGFRTVVGEIIAFIYVKCCFSQE